MSETATRLASHRQRLHQAKRALETKRSETVEALQAHVETLEQQAKDLEAAEQQERQADQLAALNDAWDALKPAKAAAWDALDVALGQLEAAWRNLVQVHGQQQLLAHDLDALPAAAVAYWVTNSQLSMCFGQTPNNTLPHPRTNDPGVSGRLRATTGALGLLAPPRDHRPRP